MDGKEGFMDHDHRYEPDRDGMKSKAKWVFIGFALIAAYFLITEHKAHLSGYMQYWPLLLVLACPLLHLFMHGGHGSHADHGHRHDAEKGDRR
jgi:hypothetical protein